MTPAKRVCDMILMDSSPLIYLAKADCLDLLLHFEALIFVPDEVYFEATGRWFGPHAIDAAAAAPPDAKVVFDFINTHPQVFQIIVTQLGELLRQQRATGAAVQMTNAGEMAAVSVYERRKELTDGRRPVLMIYEDSEVPHRLRGKDVHVLSTYALMLAMEKAGHLPSAAAAFNRIAPGSRPSHSPFDDSIPGDTVYVLKRALPLGTHVEAPAPAYRPKAKATLVKPVGVRKPSLKRTR